MTSTQNPQTTLTVYADFKARNYSTRPNIDVPILTDSRLCSHVDRETKARCDEPVRYDRSAGSYGMGKWVHTDPTTDDHYVAPRTACVYCGTQDPAEVYFTHASWSDETRCTRCGGVDGYAIGD